MKRSRIVRRQRLDALGSLDPLVWSLLSHVEPLFKACRDEGLLHRSARRQLLVRQASGSTLGQASECAVVEAAVGLWASAFAGCRLEPSVDVLTPPLLADIARRLLLDGEAVWVIDVEGGGLKLLPVGDHDVRGHVSRPGHLDPTRCTLTRAGRQHDHGPSRAPVWSTSSTAPTPLGHMAGRGAAKTGRARCRSTVSHRDALGRKQAGASRM